MPLNPLAVTQSGVAPPGVKTQPYPTLGPAQGGIGPGASESTQGMGEGGRDRLAELVRLAMTVGITQPRDMLIFLAGLGLPVAGRTSKTGLPRGVTDDPNTPAPPGAPPPPPGLSATPMIPPQALPGIG